MKERFITMGSIDQFVGAIRKVKEETYFIGMSEDNEPMFEETLELPTLVFTATEKSHGTNFGFAFTKDLCWTQSRKNIITPMNDNAGSSFLAMANEQIWKDMCSDIAEKNNVDLETHGIVLYAELQGGSVQKTAACSGLEKSFLIFEFCKVFELEPEDEAADNTWIRTIGKNGFVQSPENKIYSAIELNSFDFSIDFNDTVTAQNEMVKLIEEVEKNSIIGEKLGKKGNIGEGFVFSTIFNGDRLAFKVKGEAHSKTSKVKNPKTPKDQEKEDKKQKFVSDVLCISWRLDQMFTEIQNSVYNGNARMMSNKDIGTYLKLVNQDIIKEETNRILESGFEPKELNPLVSKVARTYFMDRLLEEV